MATINYAAKEISVKIVYYGPGLSGKTTNLQIIHRKIPKGTRGDMVSLATETDRTLFFDFLPLDLGKIRGFTAKFQLYTVPGQVYYNATRKLVLRGVDGIVFVADSAADKMDENLESLKNMEDNLAEYGYKRENIPTVLQYNKRDLPNALPISYITQKLNKYSLTSHEAVAKKGEGVFETLKLIGKLVIDQLNQKYASKKRSADTKSPQQREPVAQSKMEEVKKEIPPTSSPKPAAEPKEVVKQPPKSVPPKIPSITPAAKPVIEEVKKPVTPMKPPLAKPPVHEEIRKQTPPSVPVFEKTKPEVKTRDLSQFPPVKEEKSAIPSFTTKQPVQNKADSEPAPPSKPLPKRPSQFGTISLAPMEAKPAKLPEMPTPTREEYSSLETEIDHYYAKLKKELPENAKPDDFGSFKDTMKPKIAEEKQTRPAEFIPQQQASTPGDNTFPPKVEKPSEFAESLPSDLKDEKDSKQKSKKTFLGKLFNRDSM